VSLAGADLETTPDGIKQLCEALATNTSVKSLSLARSGLTDTGLQQVVAKLVTGALPALERLDLSDNHRLGAAADAVLHGLRRLRPGVVIVRGKGEDGDDKLLSAETDSFAAQRELIEGLTAWPLEEVLVNPGTSNDMRCPVCTYQEPLKQGLITSGGNQHRCLEGCGSYFLASIGTSQLTLIGNRRKPPSEA